MRSLKCDLNGVIVVDKPTGMTSHDVVSIVRGKIKMRRVGHAGTLDPLATGVLILLIGESTKLFSKFETFDKAYEATLMLGITTHSADINGRVLSEKPFENIEKSRIEEVLKDFNGEILQVPPMVSAIKFKGKKLYDLARRGIVVDREARSIRIDALKMIEYMPPHVRFYLECSKGTYVRQLAEDIGNKLGCGACITQIRRTKVGPFSIEESVSLENLNESYIHPWDSLMSGSIED